MAEPLKHQYGPEVAHRIAAMMAAAWPPFDGASYLRRALDGYEALELLPRGRQLANALRPVLPADIPQGLQIVVASLGEPLARTQGNGMAPFLYLPHGEFVAVHALDHPDRALDALHAITQRFTAEWAIRPFLQHHPDACMARFAQWVQDPSEHVRRLVSEGTRLRLPWGVRVARLDADPGRMLPLLVRLRDDSSDYVRRSVANHLNDLGKADPDLLLATARDWWQDAPPARRALLRHALRSRVKAGDARALGLLGHDPGQHRLVLVSGGLSPTRCAAGAAVQIDVELHNPEAHEVSAVVDLRVWYARPGGRSRAHVFKWRTGEWPAGTRQHWQRRLSMADLSTRRHHPGEHRVELLINGVPHPVGGFELLCA